MNFILLYITLVVILFTFIIYLILMFVNKKKLSKNTGMGLIGELLSEYDDINVILNKDYFTYYDIKRRIVKLNNNCYYGKNIFDIHI